jgi:CheY-like chemotaxis protein
LNILLLEDNKDLALMLRQMLEWKGHHVTHAFTGQEGVTLMQQMPFLPDLILCDLIMPAMDGIGFLQYVRANHGWARIPFVVMSADVHEGRHDVALRYGVDGCLIKPFSMEELHNVVGQWDVART